MKCLAFQTPVAPGTQAAYLHSWMMSLSLFGAV